MKRLIALHGTRGMMTGLLQGIFKTSNKKLSWSYPQWSIPRTENKGEEEYREYMN